ncbi:hypothetical protein BS17DRAFT_84916 [Gyrodon lividus]|nr:hypothetical protein BS17DRAFT_84916 [Gyrodon lividus]
MTTFTGRRHPRDNSFGGHLCRPLQNCGNDFVLWDASSRRHAKTSVTTRVLTKPQGLLLIRTMALWHHNRMVCRSLVIVYAMVAVVMFVCAVISTSLKFGDICLETSSSIATETETRLSRITVGMFSSTAAFELVVLALTILHWFKLRTASKIVTTVAQGNMVYTLSIFVTSIANITFFVLPLQDGWNGLLAIFQGVLHGVVASRILFNLRDAIHDRGDVFVFSMSRMEFAPVSRDIVRDDR